MPQTILDIASAIDQLANRRDTLTAELAAIDQELQDCRTALEKVLNRLGPGNREAAATLRNAALTRSGRPPRKTPMPSHAQMRVPPLIPGSLRARIMDELTQYEPQTVVQLEERLRVQFLGPVCAKMAAQSVLVRTLTTELRGAPAYIYARTARALAVGYHSPPLPAGGEGEPDTPAQPQPDAPPDPSG